MQVTHWRVSICQMLIPIDQMSAFTDTGPLSMKVSGAL